MALTNVNARAALAALSPVVIDLSEEVAARFSLYDEQTGQGNITQEWISDRTNLLALAMASNYNRLGTGTPDIQVDANEYTVYTDLTSGYITQNFDFAPEANRIVFGTGAEDSIAGGNLADRLYGGFGEDTISGLDGNDYLEGNVGNDTLIGGKHDDRLYGGHGNDTYIYTLGDGVDTIRDSQGNNQLILKRDGADTGTAVTRVNRIGDEDSNAYQDEDGNTFIINVTEYETFDDQREPVINQQQSLIVLLKGDNSGGMIVIEDFDKDNDQKNMGIVFEEESEEAPQTVDPFIVGNGALNGTEEVGQYFSDRENYQGQGWINNRPIEFNAEIATAIWENLGAPGGQYNTALESGPHQPTHGAGSFYAFEGGNLNDTLVGGNNIHLTPGEPGYESALAAFDIETAQWIESKGLAIGGIDVLHGHGGDDFVDGKNGVNGIHGGTGNDIIRGGDDIDFLWGNQMIRLEGVILASLQEDGFTLWEYRYTPGYAGYESEAGNGKDEIWGGGGDDRISGDEDNDLLLGEEGTDQIAGGHGSDTILGGTGSDLIFGDSRFEGHLGAPELSINVDLNFIRDENETYNDRIFGGDYSDTIFGEADDDTVFGGDHNDVILGDRHTFEYFHEFTTMSNQNQVRNGFFELAPENHGDDTLYGEGGRDHIQGNGGDDYIDGGSENDELYGDDYALNGAYHGDDELIGGTGNDTLYGDGGNDRLFGGEDDDSIFGDSGIFDLVHDGQEFHFELDEEFEGDDHLDGGAGNDDLLGQGGNDTLIGGMGSDQLRGGAGNDTYVFNTKESALGDHLWDEEGQNTIVINSVWSKEQLRLESSGSDYVLRIGSASSEYPRFQTDHIYLYGNTIASIAGIQLANGETVAINDILQTHDTFNGTVDNDTYFVDSRYGDTINEAANGGVDTVITSVSFQLPENVENLIVVEGWEGVIAQGNAGANTIIGNSQSNSIYGKGGADLLIGGRGDDNYDVVDSSTQIVELAGEGIDTVETVVSFKLAPHIEILRVTEYASKAATLEGNDQDNEIYGNSFTSNWLKGAGGNDYLKGGTFFLTPETILDGGTGDDTMVMRNGSDVFFVDSLGDVIENKTTTLLDPEPVSEDVQFVGLPGYTWGGQHANAKGNREFNGRYGLDAFYAKNLVYSEIDYTLAPGLESVALLRDRLTGIGNEADNLLAQVQGVRNSTLIGRDGNDHYQLVGFNPVSIVEEEDGGTDTVYLRDYEGHFDLSDTANVENIQVLGGSSFTAITGNALDNQIIGGHWVDGGKGNDTIEIAKSGTIYYEGGHGLDTVTIRDSTAKGGGHTIVEFGPDIHWSDLQATATEQGILLHIIGSPEQGLFLPSRGYQVLFADGNFLSIEQLLDHLNFESYIQGTQGDDQMGFNFGSGYLGPHPVRQGLEGNDEMTSSTLWTVEGGLGNDTLINDSPDFGEPGQPTRRYRFNMGDGHDIIQGFAGKNTLEFTPPLSLTDLQVLITEAGDVVLQFGPEQSITLEQASVAMDHFYLKFGSTGEYRLDQLVPIIESENISQLGALSAPIENIVVSDPVAFEWNIPTDHFVLPEPLAQASVKLEDGSALPEWLVFDGEKLRMVPEVYKRGQRTEAIRVSVTDTSGNSVSSVFKLSVAHIDTAPIALPEYYAAQDYEDSVFEYDSSFSAGVSTPFYLSSLFSNPDAAFGDTLTITATLEDGSPLPAWIDLNDSGRLMINAPASASEIITLLITATDKLGHSATTTQAFYPVPQTIDSNFSTQQTEYTGGNLYGGSGRDYLGGSNVEDRLYGRTGDDYLDGRDGNDLLRGDDGHDILAGGRGDDRLIGGNGDDSYLVRRGDGVDRIEEQDISQSSGAGYDTIIFNEGIAISDLSLQEGLVSGVELSLLIGGDQRLDLVNASAIEWFEFANGEKLSLSELIQTLSDPGTQVNHAPQTQIATVSENTLEDQPFIYSIPEQMFQDADGDTLTYVATQESGAPLPDWLTFDGRTFTGTPRNPDVGAISIRISASDGEYSAVSSLNLFVGNTNDAPEAVLVLPDRTLEAEEEFSFTFSAGSFSDADEGDDLSYTATLADGAPLPGWLQFAPHLYEFSGEPSDLDKGTYEIKLTATDMAGATAEINFDLEVSGGTDNSPPEVSSSIADTLVSEDSPISFDIPPSAFTDPEGSILTFSAILSDGSTLPSWLSFDGKTFSGTPANGDVGVLDIVVTASDAQGASAQSSFQLTVENTNDAPVLNQTLTDGGVQEGEVFRYAIPADTFTDIDAGDRLTLTATLADGTSLPEWLSFDGLSFTGRPGSADLGLLEIIVTASDGEASTSSGFKIQVDRAVADTPQVLKGDGGANTLQGAGADDQLDGYGGDDTLFGMAGDDLLRGGSGDDHLYGGQGTDILQGQSGSDIYHFSRGDGQDDIKNWSKNYAEELDVIVLEGDIQIGDVWLVNQSGHLDIYLLGSDDKLRVRNWFRYDEAQTDEIILGSAVLNKQGVIELATLMGSYGVPADGDLPLTETQRAEIDAAISSQWQGGPTPVNLAPTVADGIIDIEATEDSALEFSVPSEAFSDADGDLLTFTATLADGRALPDWLSFDGTTFSGTPGSADVGSLNLRVTASDTSGATVSTDFTIDIAATVQDPEPDPVPDPVTEPDPVPDPEPERPSDPMTVQGDGQSNLLEAGNGDDRLEAVSGDDNLYAYDGSDYLHGGSGDDTLYGGAGNDDLRGASGDDHLFGGAGDDTLRGHAGNDTYYFGRGDGSDEIRNWTSSYASETDSLVLEADLAKTDIWLEAQSGHLDVYLLGSDDRVRVTNWYKYDECKLDEIKVGSSTLDASSIEQLVSAMAAFDRPSGGLDTMSETDREQVSAIIAASWS